MEREKISVLVVDSSPSSIFYVSALLRKLRYKVQSAGTGEDALNIMASSSPALVITELALPKMSGLDFIKKIKNNAGLRFFPIIAHTADETAQLRDDCLRAGCLAHFVKPVSPEALYPAIQAAIESTPRKNIRVDAALRVQIGPEPADPRFRIERVLDISEGGIFVKTAAPEPDRTIVPITIFLQQHMINATARVVRGAAKAGGGHAVQGMAMQFTKISPMDIKLIREYVRAEVTRNLGQDVASGAIN